MRGVAIAASWVLIALGAGLAGCNNKRVDTSKSGLNRGSNPQISTLDDGASSTFKIGSVLFTNASPTDSLDVIGDGSGLILTNCGSATDTSGATRCGCVFTYTTSAGAVESFESPTTYVEANLLRCSYTGIPSNVGTVKIKIIAHDSGETTAPVDFKLQGGALALDPTDPKTYSRVRRYQCRDIVEIPHMMDGAVYDPLQSEDLNNTYGLNFYSTNFFSSMNYYTGLGIKYYDCEFNGDSSYANWVNYYLFTEGPDANGSTTLFSPTSADVSRYQFYVARQPAGSFSMPVNAYTAPQIPTTTDSATLPKPLGYGVAPTSTGTGRETCPTTVPVTGFAWKKLWLFQADLKHRTWISGSEGLRNLQTVSCNPGVFSSTGVPAIPACGTAGGLYGGTPLYSRFLGGPKICVSVSPSGRTSGDPMPQEADKWGLLPTTGANTNATNCPLAVNAGNPMNICANTLAGDPYDLNPTTEDLDEKTTRSDYVFVVTPPSVNSGDMKSGVSAYKPVRYVSQSDCTPAKVLAGTCNTDRKITYTLKETTVGASVSNKTRAFPVCVLQKQ